jgi:HCOMODA/2-hydroxy-3-carboxy-muconic semialdehyde decarboxylase
MATSTTFQQAPDTETLRAELAVATRILARHNLVGMFGHISSLLPGDRRFLIHPGAGSRKDRCTPSDVFEVALDDEWRLGLPLELYMHSEVHRLSPQVRSLVHVHAPALTQLSLFSEVPGEALVFNAGFWPDVVPVYNEADLVRDRSAAKDLARLLGDASVALLRWHGAIIAAPTVRQAVVRAIHAEENARLLLGTLSCGRPIIPLPRENARREIYERIATDRHLSSYWLYEASLVELRPETKDTVSE